MTAVMMLIGSGILFGIWDICKKKALKDNNVLAVLAIYATQEYFNSGISDSRRIDF